MAKAGRKPIGKTIADLDETLRRDIDLAIESAAGESSRSIYNRFGLAQREINIETFRKYVSKHRALQIRTDAAAVTLDEVPDWDELDKWARRHALEQLRAGNAKIYELVLLARSKREADKAAIEERVDQRANEKHDVWKRELQQKLDRERVEANAKLDRLSVEKGIPGDVAERIKDLYGIKVA